MMQWIVRSSNAMYIENALRKGSVFIEIVKFSILAFLIVMPFRMFVAQPFIVSGASMEPTFDSSEYLVVDQVSYRFEKPSRGDIVVFRYPLDPSFFFIKRIVGLPGERITVTDGVVFISNANEQEPHALVEPYLKSPSKKINVRSTTLDSDEYYMLGDNRDASADSRIWGPISKRHIVGRALVRLYPFNDTEILPGEFDFGTP